MTFNQFIHALDGNSEWKSIIIGDDRAVPSNLSLHFRIKYWFKFKMLFYYNLWKMWPLWLYYNYEIQWRCFHSYAYPRLKLTFTIIAMTFLKILDIFVETSWNKHLQSEMSLIEGGSKEFSDMTIFNHFGKTLV